MTRGFDTKKKAMKGEKDGIVKRTRNLNIVTGLDATRVRADAVSRSRVSDKIGGGGKREVRASFDEHTAWEP